MLSIILVAIIAFVAIQLLLSHFKDSVPNLHYCAFVYLIEIIRCIHRGDVRLLSNNAVISIILMLLIPSISAFIFMFAWTFIKARLLNKKNKNED